VFVCVEESCVAKPTFEPVTYQQQKHSRAAAAAIMESFFLFTVAQHKMWISALESRERENYGAAINYTAQSTHLGDLFSNKYETRFSSSPRILLSKTRPRCISTVCILARAI